MTSFTLKVILAGGAGILRLETQPTALPRSGFNNRCLLQEEPAGALPSFAVEKGLRKFGDFSKMLKLRVFF